MVITKRYHQFLTKISIRKELKREIERLSPWYQPINFGLGLYSKVRNIGLKDIRYLFSRDRGIVKWKRLIQPNIPFDLKDKRVLEVGCNAGLFLNQCIQQGAREAVGIEKDDKYFQQAQFVTKAFSKLHGRYYPVRIYQGSMESFDYSSLGKFDLALMLLVIYHIGKTVDYEQFSQKQIFEMQVQTINNVAKTAKYILLQGNPLKDEGRGKGRKSLLEIINKSDVSIVKEEFYNHPRGYLLLVKSDTYEDEQRFPLERMVNKCFLKAENGAECEFVKKYKTSGSKFKSQKTRYYQLRTGSIDWQTEGVAHLPENLSCDPVYWIMPWSYKRREFNQSLNKKKLKDFDKLASRYTRLIDSVLLNGFNETTGRIPGFLLVHPEKGSVFQYIDGNHRMGIMAYIAKQANGSESIDIPVQVRQVIERDKLMEYPFVIQMINEGYFTQDDVYLWFDNAFWFL
jgi:2-polyprenyl-3-methyl-5-hydroxy-6-metoxy-1,4-benzoquinol methylase